VAAGLRVTPSREAPSFVQARVDDGTGSEVLQWVQDSAYRFFPLVEDETFGLTLHPFDHATNKVLALAGELARGRVAFHPGRIKGAFPEIRG
jgi:hypothetical protein